jgi:hypothetical protein
MRSESAGRGQEAEQRNEQQQGQDDGAKKLPSEAASPSLSLSVPSRQVVAAGLVCAGDRDWLRRQLGLWAELICSPPLALYLSFSRASATPLALCLCVWFGLCVLTLVTSPDGPRSCCRRGLVSKEKAVFGDGQRADGSDEFVLWWGMVEMAGEQQSVLHTRPQRQKKTMQLYLSDFRYGTFAC